MGKKKREQEKKQVRRKPLLSLESALMDLSCIEENISSLARILSLPDLTQEEESFISYVLLDDSLYIFFQIYPMLRKPEEIFMLDSKERRALLLYRVAFNKLYSFTQQFDPEAFGFMTASHNLVNKLANLAALIEENPETWYLRADSEPRRELTFYEKMFFSELERGARAVDVKSILGYDPSIEKYHFFIENPETAYLRIKLKQAIAREDYELAAKIWEEIRRMRKSES